MDKIGPVFYHPILDKWFVSYHLTWHIPLNKTYRVLSFSLECSNSRPPLAKRKQQDRKASSSIAIALRCLDFLISYKVFRLRSLLKFQDFAGLLASPNNFHGVSCVGTWLCLRLLAIPQMWIAWQSATVPSMSNFWRSAKWVKQRGPSPVGTPVQRGRECPSQTLEKTSKRY